MSAVSDHGPEGGGTVSLIESGIPSSHWSLRNSRCRGDKRRKESSNGTTLELPVIDGKDCELLRAARVEGGGGGNGLHVECEAAHTLHRIEQCCRVSSAYKFRRRNGRTTTPVPTVPTLPSS